MRTALAALAVIGPMLLAEAVGRAQEGSETPTEPAPAPLPPAAPSGTTVTFAFDQERLVRDPQIPGGLAYLTVGATREAPRPVVVFLHGMNAYGEMHMSVSRPNDLRIVLDGLVVSGRIAPVVLAAPSHNKKSWAAKMMWPDFDVRAFLDATEAALGGVRLDRQRVVVVGHSGGGCNPDGGILGKGVTRASPLAVLAVDTCLKDPLLPSYLALAAAAPLRFYWQPAWKRPLLEDLAATCEGCRVEEIPDLPIKTAHSAILPAALERALPELLPPPAPPLGEAEPPLD